MGCDIHVFVEFRYDAGKWDGTGELIQPSRSYHKFGQLAGVRVDGPAALGLPEDVSPSVREAADGYGRDGHSHSWVALDKWSKVADGDPDWVAPVLYAESVLQDGYYEEARIVFWFDN